MGVDEPSGEDDIGSPSVDGQTLYDLLANADISTVTDVANSLTATVRGNLDAAVSSRATPAEVSRRIRVVTESGLGSQPPEVQTKTSGTNGGATSFDEFGGGVSSATATDDAAAIYSLAFDNVASLSGVVLVGGLFYHDTAIGTASTDYPVLGYLDTVTPDATPNNIAVFNPGAGDSTSGNVRVDNGGTDTDGSVSYPSLTEIHYYEVAIDTDAGETRFYIDDSDLSEGTPRAIVSAVPAAAGRAIGYGIVGANSNTFYASRFTFAGRADDP